ncbi:MAG: penicillin acylase family protein, partial [Gemmatimonadetes bacterium]|nr:penicillin acylase family protein [Gemmatimonadota bacterium]
LLGGRRPPPPPPPPTRPTTDSVLAKAAHLLASWDRRYARDSKAPALFELAMGRLAVLTWDELAVNGRRVATPGDAVLAELLQDRASTWWDHRATADHVETRNEILRQSLIDAWNEATKRYGEIAGEGWRWDQVQHMNIYHLLRIPAFSALGLPPPGGRGTISPSSGNGFEGSSWRMVVELGPEVRGWGIYPGGQSGNPVSVRYRDRLEKWVNGELDTLRMPRQPADLSDRITSRLQLLGGDQ